MKIKIIKDIPGYKAGEYESDGFISGHEDYEYSVPLLIKNGFAEEIKDDIDIEAIRENAGSCMCGDKRHSWHEPRMQSDEYEWLKSYRIVKAVIKQLNSNWKPDSSHESRWTFCYDYSFKIFDTNVYHGFWASQFPL